MTNILLGILILISLVILILLLTRNKGDDNQQLLNELESSLRKSEILQEQLLKSVKDDFQRSREEGSAQSKQKKKTQRRHMNNSFGNIMGPDLQDEQCTRHSKNFEL